MYVGITTTLSACAGGLSSFALGYALDEFSDVSPLINGILAGLVSITGCAHGVMPWAAVIIGGIGGCVYHGATRLLLRWRIDDPLDAAPVHLFCGLWGVIANGLFLSNMAPANLNGPRGLFYGDGIQFLVQVMGAIVTFLWTSAWMAPSFWLLYRYKLFRVSEKVEKMGLDIMNHGRRAYETDEELLRALRELWNKMDEVDTAKPGNSKPSIPAIPAIEGVVTAPSEKSSALDMSNPAMAGSFMSRSNMPRSYTLQSEIISEEFENSSRLSVVPNSITAGSQNIHEDVLKSERSMRK